MKFEVLSSKKQQSSATLFGVLVTEQSVSSRARAMSEGDAFSSFMDRARQIEDAVITAFALDYGYCTKFRFSVTITRSTSISPTERMRLILDGLRGFNVSKDIVVAAQKQMNEALKGRESKVEEGRTTAVELLWDIDCVLFTLCVLSQHIVEQQSVDQMELTKVTTPHSTAGGVDRKESLRPHVMHLLNQGLTASMINDLVEEVHRTFTYHAELSSSNVKCTY